MATPKEEIRKILDTLPDDATWEDVQYSIYVRERVERGRREANQDKLLDVTCKANPPECTNREYAASLVPEVVNRLKLPAGSTKYGTGDQARIAAFGKQLQDVGILTKPPAIPQLFKNDYVDDFNNFPASSL